MALTDEQRERLAALRAKDAEREVQAQEERDARELEARELEAALEAAGMKSGVDFVIVQNPLCGVFAVRKPDRAATRAWDSADERKKLSTEWQIGVVRRYIVDPKDLANTGLTKRGMEWATLAGERPGLCWQTCSAFIGLMGADLGELQRK